MSNPMMKKNPFMSMWLSGANSVAGAARGQWMGELHRQQRAMAEQVIRFWTGAWMLPTGRAGDATSRTPKRR